MNLDKQILKTMNLPDNITLERLKMSNHYASYMEILRLKEHTNFLLNELIKLNKSATRVIKIDIPKDKLNACNQNRITATGGYQLVKCDKESEPPKAR